MGWDSFGSNINKAFYFVIDKITDMMTYFLDVSKGLFKIVLLIALLTAGLNYILNGTGLKENLIKILKATLFFLIVTAVYPRIIGSITNITFKLAEGSVYKSVKEHFNKVTDIVEKTFTSYTLAAENVQLGNTFSFQGKEYKYQNDKNSLSFTYTTGVKITNDNEHLFYNLTQEHTNEKTGLNYIVVAPANVMKIVFFIAGECIGFADQKKSEGFFANIPEFSRILKGLICAGVLIFTGCFALLEYVVCFLEFMLVASVGIILLPMSIWEGSKFLAEGFIKAIFGFTVKLLFCNLAIFLLLYGFITLFYIISAKVDGNQEMGFTGNVEQIVFIVFTSLLFFFICKSAPGVAQSLISGSPSLNGAGAIGAVAGAVGAAAAVGGIASGAAKKIGNAAVGGAAMGRSAKEAFQQNGGNVFKAAGAFFQSAGRQVSQGLARSLTGGRSGDNTLSKLIDSKKKQ